MPLLLGNRGDVAAENGAMLAAPLACRSRRMHAGCAQTQLRSRVALPSIHSSNDSGGLRRPRPAWPPGAAAAGGAGGLAGAAAPNARQAAAGGGAHWGMNGLRSCWVAAGHFVFWVAAATTLILIVRCPSAHASTATHLCPLATARRSLAARPAPGLPCVTYMQYNMFHAKARPGEAPGHPNPMHAALAPSWGGSGAGLHAQRDSGWCPTRRRPEGLGTSQTNMLMCTYQISRS